MKIVLFVAVAISASAATAADPIVTDTIKEKKICRTMEPDIGSNVTKRVCKTRAEWAQQKPVLQGNRIDLDKFRDTASQFSAPH